MVTKWGLSEKLGPLTYTEEEGEVFLGHSVTKHKLVSDETAHLIDEEVRTIIDRNYQRADSILNEHTDTLHLMAHALLKYETLDSEQIKDIMEGKEPRPPQDSGDDASSGDGSEAVGTDGTDESSTPGSGEIGGPASLH